MPDYPTDTPLGQRMKLLGYTLTEVSAMARVDRWHMNDYLHGRRSFSPIHLARLCSFLKCTPEFLTGEQDSQ